jgi:coproporphyrinogen III oxidase-like Fe-S oxidoreductase
VHTERVMLTARLRSGLDPAELAPAELAVARERVADGLLVETAGRLVLTPRGRLLADAVVRDVLVAGD